MILIIEDKDDPTGQIAEETDGGSELVYIPVITAPTESDARRLKTQCVLDRMSYELRKNEAGEVSVSQNTQNLMPLFLKAVGQIGRRPEYLSSSVSAALFGAEPEDGYSRLYTRG